MTAGNWRRLWLALAAAMLITAAWLSGFGALISIDTLRAHRQELTQFVASQYWHAAMIYVAIYIVAVAASLPGAVFLTLAGGFLFGPATGAALTVFAATIGATLVFLFARIIFGDAVLDRCGERGRRLAANIRRNAWPYLLALRLAPIFPFFLVNLIPAFAGVRRTTFVWTTVIGILPGTLVFSLSGGGLASVLDQGGTLSACSILTPEIIAGLTGLAVLSLAAIPLRRYCERAECANKL